MRTIHPVGVSERFIASGTYLRQRDDSTERGWSQIWAIHEQPDGAQKIRVDGDERESTGRSTLIEAWVSPPEEGGQIDRIDFNVFGGPQDTVKHVRATFSFFADHAEISRKFGAGEHTYEEVPLEPGMLRAASALPFIGLVVAQIVKQDAPAVVIANKTALDSEAALSANVEAWRAELIEETTLQLGTKSYPARLIEFTAGDTPPSRVWLDAHDTPLRLELSGNDQTIILADYARSNSF